MSRERHRMLQLLGGHDWVPSDTLSAEFCQYGRIIFQLRREGFEIINKVVPTRTGKRGYFKWLSEREALAFAAANGRPFKATTRVESKDDGQAMLFEMAGERHRDDG